MIPVTTDRRRTSHALTSAVLEALERLASKVGVDVARTSLRRAVERASRDVGEWEEIARRAGREVGLDVRSVRLTVAELRARDVLPPLVTVENDLVVEGNAVAKNAASDQEVTFVTATPATGLDPLRGREPGASPFRRLLGLIRLERHDIWVALVYAVAIGVLSLATPLGVQLLVNTVAFGALVQPVVVLTLMVFAGLAFAATLRALQAFVIERVQERIFVRVALDFSQRLPRVEAASFREQHGPELVNRFFEVVTVQKGVATLLVDGTALVLQSVVGLVVLSLYHPYLLGVALVLGFVVSILVLLGYGGTKSAIDESKAKYAVAEWLQEIARHPNAFRSEQAASRAVVHGEDLTRVWLGKRRKHFGVVFRQMGVSLAAQVIGSAGLLGVGGWLVVARQLTLGQLVAAELIVTAVLAALSKLGKYFELYYDLLASLDKFGQIVDLPVERGGGSRAPGSGPLGAQLDRIAVDGAIEGVSLKVREGSRIAVLDASEKGASAIVDVLVGNASPDSGLASLGDIDIRELDLASLRDTCAVVRGPEVFAGTIAENVALGGVGHAEARRALEMVGAWSFVGTLPQGVDTHVSTHGLGLPRCFAERITLARAIAKRPRLLVLDRALDRFTPHERHDLLHVLAAPDAPWSLVVTTRDPEIAVSSSFSESFAVEDGKLSPFSEVA